MPRKHWKACFAQAKKDRGACGASRARESGGYDKFAADPQNSNFYRHPKSRRVTRHFKCSGCPNCK